MPKLSKRKNKSIKQKEIVFKNISFADIILLIIVVFSLATTFLFLMGLAFYLLDGGSK
jgi:hypothetical protein